MYKVILTSEADPKTELEFVFVNLVDATGFVSDAFETTTSPLVATIGEVKEV